MNKIVLGSLLTLAALLLFCPTLFAANSLPVVTTFTVAPSAVSPIPISAFVATDSDGTVVGYMVTQTSSKPAANDSHWTPTWLSWQLFTTSSYGSLTLYAWAKDNAGGVSNAKTAPTYVVGGHTHAIGDITGLTSALANKADIGHNHDSLYQKKYTKVKVVSLDGNGDFTSPVDAMNSITDASATNPYLVKIMPGVYIIGYGVVRMKEYVDIEGSGEQVTIISGLSTTQSIDPGYGRLPTAAVVMGANNAELRSLTVSNYGPRGVENFKIAILNSGASPVISNVTSICRGWQTSNRSVLNYQASPVMENMTIIAADGGTDGYDNIAVENYESSPVMKNLTIIAHTVGVENQYSSPEMTNLKITTDIAQGIILSGSSPVIKDVTITALEGIHIMQASSPTLIGVKIMASQNALAIYGDNQQVTIDHSIIEGGAYSIIKEEGGLYTMKIGASKLAGPTSFGTGNLTCAGVYDGNYNALNSTCQ